MRCARVVVCGLLTMSLAVFTTANAKAEDMSKEEMVQSLKAKRAAPTRDISAPAAAEKSAPMIGAAPPPATMESAPSPGPGAGAPAASSPSQHDLADQLRTMTRNSRQITVEERKKVAKTVKEGDLPAIDVEVFFAYDSSAILPQALPKLITLGQALSDPQLDGNAFLIGGHTDAKGSDGYNLTLSGRRADAVKRFLVQNFHLRPERLITLGFGEEQLKDPQDPFGGENRRVQIVNIEAAPIAQQ